MSAALRPVVIQTMWRTGGTYLAFMLRERNRLALFYEPLHEDYSRFTQAQWDGFAAAGDGATRGHPAKSFHYLTDFPFLPGAGVVGHREQFAFQQFALGRGDSAPELAAYLDGLVAHAQRQGRRALFKFCRGFLRQRWLEAKLDPVTVYLARRPTGMIASYARLGPGYFYGGYLRILADNRNAPIFAGIHQRLASAHPEYGAASDLPHTNDALGATVPPQTQRDLFLLFWALAMAVNTTPEILLLDAGALGADARSSAEALRLHTGLDIDLADAVALDPGEGEIERFHGPHPFGGWLRNGLSPAAPEFDAGLLPPSLRPQFEALVAAE